MFSLETGFRKPISAGEKVVTAAASNYVLFLGTDTGRLLRWDTLHDDLEEIKLTRAPKDQPRRIFPDYESRDFIVSFGTADNYYVKDSCRYNSTSRLSFGSSTGERPRALGRIRGVTLTAAHFLPSEAWRLFGNMSEQKTSPSEGGTESPRNKTSQRFILLGSDNGVVLGLFVDSTTGKDENVFKLWNVPGAEAIYGIRGEIVSDTALEKIYAFTAIVCTNNRLYQFVGNANLEIFEKHPHVLEITPSDSETSHRAKMTATNSSTLPQSPNISKSTKQSIPQRLHFFTLDRGRRAQKFCWLTGAGVIHGELDWKRVVRSQSSSVIMNKALIRLDGSSGPHSSVLLACSLTEFYVVLLYVDRVILVNQISGKIFQELNVSFTSSLRSAPPQFASIAPSSQMNPGQVSAFDIVQDVANNALWIYSNNGYFLRLFCDNEEEGIWKVALSMNRFDVALRLSQTEEQARQVFLAQADWLAEVNGSYREAAKLYAKTRKPMEEVLLKLLKAPWKVSSGELNPIMEYLISLLDHMSFDLPMQRTIIATLILEEYCKILCIPSIVRNDLESLRIDFDAFLQDHWQDLDLKTSFSILLSHGLWDAAVTLSVYSKKWQNAIQICIQNKAYKKALDIMKQVEDPEMFSKFAGFLSLHVPKDLALTALSYGEEAITRVLPALLRTFHFSSVENIRQEAFYGCLVLLQTVNNIPYYSKMMFRLYALDKNEDAALEFFRYLYPKLEPRQLLDYCMFTMRCCLLGNFGKGCVQVFQSLGMHSDAVELACRMDSNYAKDIVSELSKMIRNNELIRKFWLRVALAVGGCNPSNLLKVMEDSNGILQVEDVMPLMEDFLEMDEETKNAVCQSLVDNQDRIQSAIEIASRAEGTVEELGREMEDLKKKKAEEKVSKDRDTSYYVRFPCGHYFEDRESVLNSLTDLDRNDTCLNQGILLSERTECWKEQYLVEQCPLCGEDMIETIDRAISLHTS